MARSSVKKFGTFAGVFTPSVLTILGVIMYMRLGWVVGEAGIFGALGIILIAHIISISTGLSISSIATDKKIKTGGIYYMLSRSLGLPMGGSIGIVIFLGTALSISLYIIGFCENFLGIEAVSDFIGLGNTIADYRLLGTMVIIVLVILAFISTSLAIKTQFIILGAIFLSLVSIFWGLLSGTPAPEIPAIAARDNVPLETVFAIFFPAVTGFTAGVAMSGDLKNPKKAIPVGTMAAIAVGLVVYVGLAIVFGFLVDRDLLINDKNFLMRTARWAPLVIAGIWGATLSSALGGILGAPRILQAISKDKITPKLFAKGVGANSEPRNALIFTFLIAECGILIGELDLIARIVSMFYIAAYGALNLAYALENWASSDFRPSFRIRNWIAILGFIASIVVMFRIDILSMVLAILIIWGIYFFLKKKELKLDFGDVWQSVWSNIIRASLHKIDRRELEERNWRPNIILFSGGSSFRKYLISFSKALVGKHGFLSNFDLVENGEDRMLFAKHEQSVSPEDDLHTEGVFTRRQSCKNFFEGVEGIAQSYGFSGVEPNTVCLPWSKQSADPYRFGKMVRTLSELDLNILMMDFDPVRGFGEKKQIDVWWRGGGNNGNLVLSLVKFLWASNDWRQSELRLLMVNPVNEQKEKLESDARQVLDNLRIPAEIKVINNQIENKSFYEIIRVESVNSDLIFLGLPVVKKGEEKAFVEKTDDLCRQIGTVVLVKASTTFKNLHIGEKTSQAKEYRKPSNELEQLAGELPDESAIKWPDNPVLKTYLSALHDNLSEDTKEFFNTYFDPIASGTDQMYAELYDIARKSLDGLNLETKPMQYARIRNQLMIRIKSLIAGHRDERFSEWQESLENGLEYYWSDLSRISKSIPSSIRISLEDKDLEIHKSDPPQLVKFKKRRSGKGFFARSRSYYVKYGLLYNRIMPLGVEANFLHTYKKWGQVSIECNLELTSILKAFRNKLLEMEVQARGGELSDEKINAYRLEILDKIKAVREKSRKSVADLAILLHGRNNKLIQRMSAHLSNVNPNYSINRIEKSVDSKSAEKYIRKLPSLWIRNQRLSFNALMLEVLLLFFRQRTGTLVEDIKEQFEKKVGEAIQPVFEELADLSDKKIERVEGYTFRKDDFDDLKEELLKKVHRQTKSASTRFPITTELMDEETFNNFFESQYSDFEPINLSASRLLEFILRNDLFEPVQLILEETIENLEGITGKARDHSRLIVFSRQAIQSHPENESETESEVQRTTVQILKDYKQIRENFVLRMDERASRIQDQLDMYALTRVGANLKQYIRKQESRKRYIFLRKALEKWNSFISKLSSQFWYRQSKGVLLAKKLSEDINDQHISTEEIIELSEVFTLSKKQSDKLPFFYSQMFLGSQNFYPEFRAGLEKQLPFAEEAVRRFNSGAEGAIAVTGDPFSGKSFLSQLIPHLYLPGRQNIIVRTVAAGSTKADDLWSALADSAEMIVKDERIFDRLVEGSVIIFEDIECWWEKSNSSNEALLLLLSWIRKYGSKFLFIVNLNTYAYALLDRLFTVRSLLLSRINLSPFNAETIRDMIMVRQQSAGFRLNHDKKATKNIRSWEFAKMFNRIFQSAHGNPGIAMHFWLASVKRVEDKDIFLQTERLPDTSALDKMDHYWYLLFMQFILHKRMTAVKLCRIMQAEESRIENYISYFLKTGILEQKKDDVMELHPVWEGIILRKLIEKEIL